MKRFASAALLVAAVACGSGDPEPTTTSQPVESGTSRSAESGTSRSERVVDAEPLTEEETAVHASVPRCLDLVAAGKLVEAVPPCTEAVKNAPGNQEVADALARAQAAASEQASAAARAAASDAAAAGAGGDAASALQEQSGSLPTQLP